MGWGNIDMLTKKDYVLFKQCHKALWLQKNHAVVLRKGEPSEENSAWEHAKRYYSGGVEVIGETWEERLAETNRLLEEGVPVLYKPVFSFGEKLVSIDIATHHRTGWKMTKVTSSTSVKERMLDGLAYDWYDILQRDKMIEVEVLHINKEYVREEVIDYNQLFHRVDVRTDIVVRTEDIQKSIPNMHKTAELPTCQTDIGPHCLKYGKDAVECPAKAHCWGHIPEYSVFDITRIGKKAWELYQEGIVDVKDIPDNYKLSDAQRFQVEGEKKNAVIIDKPAIRSFLKTFTFPLYFLDFETHQQPVPKYKGIKPYQQIPFQYSLHVLPSELDNLVHKEFLADERKDDRRALAEQLVRDIPRGVTTVVYNMSFEKKVLQELASIFPDLAEHLLDIHDHIVDLMIPFQKKWYYTPEMKGSYSIKYILPALCPNEEALDYKQLAVQNGSMAMDIFAKLPTLSPEEREQVRRDLRAYCHLDTFAMVRIWEVLDYV